MRILTIECSSAGGSIAFTDGGRVQSSHEFENPRGRGTEFFAVLAEEVSCHATIDLVLVGTGPGSYNSLRSSIAAAWGVARSRDVPLRGICSLLGYDVPDYHVLGDARAGQWFHGHVREGNLVASVALLRPEEALMRLEPGVPVFTPTPSVGGAARIAFPCASVLARHTDQAGLAEPIYLKPPYTTLASNSL